MFGHFFVFANVTLSLLTYVWFIYFVCFSDVDGTVRLNIDKDDDVENQYSKSVVPKQKIKYPTYSHCAKFPRAGFHQSMTDNLLCLFFQGKHRAVGDTRSTMTSIDQTCTAVESAVGAW